MSKIAKFGCEMLSNAENIALQSLQILYTFVLRAKIATIFGPNVVAISARNTTSAYKYTKFSTAFYNVSQPSFTILLILVCSFREYTFFCQDKKLLYNGNCPLIQSKLI
jgi:hypothetical protein